MRRRIELYIGDLRADLDNDSLVLFNYTAEDLSNPTNIVNSFSQSVTLKGTTANNAIFGAFTRLDRATAAGNTTTGASFNASQKTPFRIYDETGVIMASGYARLDEVTRLYGKVASYKVSLFGGLGGFLYGLSYNADGSKRTLADLNYMSSSADDLQFVITKNAVMNAWDLSGTRDAIWDYINFAPCYNGIPTGDFSADKAVFNPADFGLSTTSGDYTTVGGVALIDLPEALDEWEVRDLRSYLQRPILSVTKLLDAIADPNNNGGYTVTFDGISTSGGVFTGLWLTLPLLSSLVDANGNPVRSQSTITKKMLLATKYSPAEYLAAIIKTFGLAIMVDEAEKTVTICKRDKLYAGASTIDLTSRIDADKEIKISPFTFTTRWYDFAPEIAQGAFAEAYLVKYGIQYGIQSVDTSYSFDQSVTNLLEKFPLRSAVPALHTSWYFYNRTTLSIWIDNIVATQRKYYLYNFSDNSKKEITYGFLGFASQAAWNASYGGYDVQGGVKLELCDASKAGVDGEDILVWRDNQAQYTHFVISDDIAAMETLNEGKPCWYIAGQKDEPTKSIPMYRPLYLGSGTIDYSLDFGAPRELAFPGFTYSQDASLYAKAWRSYIRDRYDVDAKVLTCRVNFNGIFVGPELLRKFYYYEGCIWVLNRIINHSLTTYDPTECEFVKVADAANYTNGQTI